MVYPGDAGIPESLFSNDYSAFAPRIGLRLGRARNRPRPSCAAATASSTSTPPDDLHAHGEHAAERADGEHRQPLQLPRARIRGVAGGSPYPVPAGAAGATSTRSSTSGRSRAACSTRRPRRATRRTGTSRFEQQLPAGLRAVVRLRGQQGHGHPGRDGTEPGGLRARRHDRQHEQPADRTDRHERDGDRDAVSSGRSTTRFQLTATKRASSGLSLPRHLRATGRPSTTTPATIGGAGVVPEELVGSRHRLGLRRTSTSGTGEPVVRVRPAEISTLTGLAGVLVNDWQVNGIFVARAAGCPSRS